MATVFSNTTKLMLKNVIRHTNSHNKTVEESEMWQQFERMKGMGGLDPSNPSYGHDDRCEVRAERRGRGDYWNSRSAKSTLLSTTQGYRRAHMDEEKGGDSAKSSSTYWMRQLEKMESSDPNRWDHSGFRELYPDQFDSDRSRSHSPAHTDHRSRDRKSALKKKSKRKRERSESKKHKHKKGRANHKRKKQTSSSSTSDDSDSDSSTPKKRKHKEKQKKSHKHKVKKSHKHSSSKKPKHREEQENRLLTDRWKDTNGLAGSSQKKDFDRHSEKETCSQYSSLKRKHMERENRHTKGTARGSGSEDASSRKRRRRKYSQSSSSDSD